MCGQCHSFSAHLYEILGSELGPWDGMTMKREFCDALTSECSGQIAFGEYDGLDFCDKHVGGTDGNDRFWSYPYQEGEDNTQIARRPATLQCAQRTGLSACLDVKNLRFGWMFRGGPQGRGCRSKLKRLLCLCPIVCYCSLRHIMYDQMQQSVTSRVACSLHLQTALLSYLRATTATLNLYLSSSSNSLANENVVGLF